MSDQGPRHFFFYGTLQREDLSDTARRVLPKLNRLGRTFLRGRLFAVRGQRFVYPALLPTLLDGQYAFGTCFEMGAAFTARDLAQIDSYEDYFPPAPETSEYLRKRAEVTLEKGGRVEAWCYFYRASLPDDAEPIPSGDFMAYLAAASRK